jgi:hypothetical protein
MPTRHNHNTVRNRRSLTQSTGVKSTAMEMSMSVEAQALGWKIAIVRSIHGSTADSWSVDDLIGEFQRMQETIVTVRDQSGKMSARTELELRLGYERAW